MKTERQRWCDSCNRTGKVRVNVAAASTSGQNFGTCNTEEMRVCFRCGGRGKVVEVTETTVIERRLEDNEK